LHTFDKESYDEYQEAVELLKKLMTKPKKHTFHGLVKYLEEAKLEWGVSNGT